MGYGKEGRSSLINGLRQGRKGGSVINELKQVRKGAHLLMGYSKEGRELIYQWVTARKEGEISHRWVNGLMNSYHI